MPERGAGRQGGGPPRRHEDGSAARQHADHGARWSVLGAGVLATTLVVPEALHDRNDRSVPAAGSLLVAGLTLLGASAAGLRLRHEAR